MGNSDVGQAVAGAESSRGTFVEGPVANRGSSEEKDEGEEKAMSQHGDTYIRRGSRLS